MVTQIKGVVPIVLTPLKQNGDIDIKSCESLVEYLVESDAAALYILGSASEQFLLNHIQRVDMIFAVSEANKGRVPIIAGCSSMAPRNVFDLFKEVKTANIHGFHYIPEDLKIGDTQLIYMLNTYADVSSFPIYLYHNIKRGKALSFDVVASLKSHPNILGIKVGGYNHDEMKQFLTLDDDSFQVMGAGGSQFYTWLELGARAVTASAACCFPDMFNDLYTAFNQRDKKNAEKIQRRWNSFHADIPNTAPDNGEYAAEEKYILKRLGIIQHDFCHFPYRKLDREEKRQIDHAMEKYNMIKYNMRQK